MPEATSPARQKKGTQKQNKKGEGKKEFNVEEMQPTTKDVGGPGQFLRVILLVDLIACSLNFTDSF